MPDAAPRHYRFAHFHLDTQTRELRRDGVAVPLTAKAFDTLRCLVEHRDRVVAKDELLAMVWPGRVVEENNLTQAISALRRGLGTGAGEHRCIVTVPGRGYRFVAEIEAAGPDPRALPVVAERRVAPAFARPGMALAGGALALALAAVIGWLPGETAPAPSPSPTQSSRAASAPAELAVLPFRSLSDGPRDRVLELGMAETLIAQLSRSDRMPVRSLAAAQRLVRWHDAVEAGRQLHAAYVVEGSTQHQGDRVRVNARLLNVADGRTLWAGTFDESRDRVFTLQDAIAAELSAALALKVRPASRYHSPCDGEDTEAYRAYIAGRYLLGRPDAASLPGAAASLERAIALDPACARAHAGLARIHISQVMGADADPRRALPLARAAVARALALDPSSSEAYLARGHIAAWFEWSWKQALADYRRAVVLDPNAADAHLAYSLSLSSVGRTQEADLHVQRAARLDPLSPRVQIAEASSRFQSDPEGARIRLQRALELDPANWNALLERGGWSLALGRPREAIADLQQAVERSGRQSQTIAFLAKAYVDAGERERAVDLLRELQARRRYVPAMSLARIHMALGEDEAALDQLERGYAERDPRMAIITASRAFARLRPHPRFQALVQRMESDGASTAVAAR
jgi:serine/threonine-protein kinase